MSRRTIEISGFDARLSVKNGQVVLTRENTPVAQFHPDDVGMLISDTRNSTFSNSTLVQIANNGGLVVLCGDDHLPAALVVPVDGNQLLHQRQQLQLEISTPLRKRLWQEIVRAKITNQANATGDNTEERRLKGLAGRVKSGDPDNVEAQAARRYWASWLPGERFRRDRDGQTPNLYLNYGYMTLRAAVARSLYATGLNPSFGLHHCNRSNPFCLADDLMEPFRPFVDIIARELHQDGKTSLDKQAKARLLSVLYQTCAVDEFSSTIQNAIDRLTRSLFRRISGDKTPLSVPRLITLGQSVPPEAHDTDEDTFRA